MNGPSRFHFRNHTKQLGNLPTPDCTQIIRAERTPEAAAVSDHTGGRSGLANRGGSGPTTIRPAIRNKLKLFALTNARPPAAAFAASVRAFIFARGMYTPGNFCAGARVVPSPLALDYRSQNCHQWRGAAFKALWAKSRCSSAIWTSLASICRVSNATTSKSWLDCSVVPEDRSLCPSLPPCSQTRLGRMITHWPLTFRPLSKPFASRRRMVFSETDSSSAAPNIVVSIWPRINSLFGRCEQSEHNWSTHFAQVVTP